jgi:hypothetical protein
MAAPGAMHRAPLVVLSSFVLLAACGSGSIGHPPATDGAPGSADGPGADAAAVDTSAGAAADAAAEIDAEAPPPVMRDFRHPGVLVNRGQLDLLRDRIKAGAQPWKGAYDKAMGKYGDLAYQARPFATVECGSYSNPNNGCSEERNDGVAAYTHALAWYVTGDEAHARKAIEIMNAWAATLKGHSNSNAPLQTGWGGAIWPLGAEIIRHLYGKWPQAEVDTFSRMLRDLYLASTLKGSGSNGNWELVMIEASIEIAVFLDDRASFDRAVAMFRQRVPAYFYLTSDGPTPVPPPAGNRTTPAQLVDFWSGQSTFVDGLSQETCRDFVHTQYGIASSLAIAETAYQQGVDLYAEQSERLRTTMEFHADYLLGKAPPATLCGGNLSRGDVLPTWEIGYNHFHDRLGMELPLTRMLIETKVRATSGVDHHMVWETITHAATARAGTPM